MLDWFKLALLIAFAIAIGLGLRLYLCWRHPNQVERLQRVSRSLSWPYYAAGMVFFIAFAAGSRDNTPRLVFYLLFAAIQLYAFIRVFVRERTQYGIRHLLITMTFAAVLAALCRWFGMAMAVVLGVAAGAAILFLYALEWVKHRQGRNETDGANVD